MSGTLGTIDIIPPAVGSIIAALIAVLGVALTAAVAFRTARHLRVVTSITADRIKWLTDLRLNTAAFCGAIRASMGNKSDLRQEIERLGALIRLQLDVGYARDREIDATVTGILECYRSDDDPGAIGKCEQLIEAVRTHTNIEYRKAGMEARNGRLKPGGRRAQAVDQV